MPHHIIVDLQNPYNTGVVSYLSERSPGSPLPVSVSPESCRDPCYELGTHPDLVNRLWHELTIKIPQDSRWVLYGTPVLVNPESGIVFAFAHGTRVYALRLAEWQRREALRMGAKRIHVYSDGASLNLDTIGPEWVFGNWLPDEDQWCVAAYDFASSTAPR